MPVSMEQLSESAWYILIGAGLAAPLLYGNLLLAPTLGLIDWPKARGVSREQIPLLGCSLVGLTLALIAFFTYTRQTSSWFLVTSSAIALMGFLDDRRSLPAFDKLFCQLVCALVMVEFDPDIRHSISSLYGHWGKAWAVFFILGLVNAVNFIDGINGLLGIVLLVGSGGFLFIAHGAKMTHSYVLLSAMMCGMMLAFLYLNVFRRSGFMGNVGSYFFSYVLAILHLSVPLHASGVISRLSLTGLCFLIPVADSLMVILSRLVTLRSPFQPDRGHLHHRLLQTSVPLEYVLLNFALIEISAMLVGFFLSVSPDLKRSVMPWFVGLSHISISAVLIYLIERASRRRLQFYFEWLDIGESIFFLKYRFKNPDGSPLSILQLQRVEARVSAEIRVTDLCFLQSPDTLFVVLRTLAEPLIGISARLDAVFGTEKIEATLLVDHGEIRKVVKEGRSLPRRVRS